MQPAQLIYLYLCIVTTVFVFVVGFHYWEKFRNSSKRLHPRRTNGV